jgi:hypothetical protein
LSSLSGNDILSAKKELVSPSFYALISARFPVPPSFLNLCIQAAGCVHNAVPVMYHQGQPLSAIIPQLIKRLEESRDRFNDAAFKVLEMCKGADSKRPGILAAVTQYIDGLRTIATGTIEFCKISPRYGLEPYFNQDESMDVML